MGWASGSEIARPVIEAIRKEVASVPARRRLYKALIDALASQDWDTLDEAYGIDPVCDKIIDYHFE
jgi:hypothetical protein